MRYTPTKDSPTLSESIRKVYAICFPEIQNGTAYEYMTKFNKGRFFLDPDEDIACKVQATKSLYNKNVDISAVDSVSSINEDSVWYLIEKLLHYDKPNLPGYNDGSAYPSTWNTRLDPFVDWNYKSVNGWFNGSPKKMQDSVLYRASGYYALGILYFADSKSYINYFFDRFGIQEDINAIYDAAQILNWLEDLVLLATYILLGCSSGNDWLIAKLEILETVIDEKMQPIKTAEVAEKSWLTDVYSFRPRSIDNRADHDLSMQDFYVQPVFESQSILCEEPIKRMSLSNTSTRFIVVSQTGMGKSMYIRMASLCLCRNRLEGNKQLDLLSQNMNAPDNMYVLYIPAYMFSYCYQNSKYKVWTNDLVKLYFNCMFKLSASINFDKHELREKKQVTECSDYEITDDLLKYINILAQKGRLILLADSFDEIASDDMRKQYINALRKFRKEYCNIPERAHVLVTSRDMSQDTMETLASSLDITMSSGNIYRIKPLSTNQQKELILNWDRAFGNGIRENINELDNHYFADLCSNPYMLSFVCNSPGAKINIITEKLISAILHYRTKAAAGMLENDLLRSMLESKQIKEILQDLAFETVQISAPHFSLDLLAKHCMSRFSDLDFTEDDLHYCYEVLITLFTTSVGLIVPADNEDDRFQFISNQIRYELAAAKLSGEATKYGTDAAAIEHCFSFLHQLKDDSEYVALIVPLICKTKRIPLAESLIKHLVLRSFSHENSGLADQAMIDLLLGRYGLNITCSVPSKSDPNAYDHYVSADRLIMLRLLSSPTFSPSSSEKDLLLKSNALQVCDGFLNNNQMNFLQES